MFYFYLKKHTICLRKEPIENLKENNITFKVSKIYSWSVLEGILLFS